MIKTITQNHFGVNSYVLYDDTKECVLVDICSQSVNERKEVTDFIEGNGLKPKHILLTHPHVDHMCGASFICKKYGLPLGMSVDAKDIFMNCGEQAYLMGFETGDIKDIKIESLIDGETIKFGKSEIKCLNTSGHCKGSLSFYNEKEKYIITGDALFAQSIGRTDLPTGHLDELIDNLKKHVLSLPYDTVVYPGHGPSTTVGYEKDCNPFLL